METIKCKSCGAVQEVNNNISSCNFCGSAIEVQQSKDYYKEIVKSEFGNFLMMAETAEEATNFEEAANYYNRILEKDTTYSDAWLGKGNCSIYSSKIGDIKMKEGLTYWKNAIKFAENQEPMKLRVGKEINNVVKAFFPNLLNHYYEFSGLDDSYVDLTTRFLLLEQGIDYACQICPNEAEFFQSGFDLCELVIKAPRSSAKVAEYVATGSAVFNTLAGNKYSATSDRNDRNKAIERKKQIQNFGNKIQIIANKYFDGLLRLGIKSASQRQSTIEIKPINEVKYKAFAKEFVIAIVVLFGSIILISNLINRESKLGGPILLILLASYFLYYFLSFSKRCKGELGMTYLEATKILKENK